MTKPDLDHFARLLADANRARARLEATPDDVAALDADQADAAQLATAALIGPIGGWKVSQVGDQDGSLGVIFANDMRHSPCAAALGLKEILIEIEVAFRFGRDLRPRGDGASFTREDVEGAVDAVLPVFELLCPRLPLAPKPSATLARADRMGNLGLILGAPVADWRAVVSPRLRVEMEIDGAPAVALDGGHPSDDPFHPLVWLANAIARAGRFLRAGDIVTTGAYGGGHAIRAGSRARGRVEGLGALDFSLLE